MVFRKFFLETGINKAKVKMNKAIYSVLSTLEISKTVLYELCYEHIKPKYQDKANICYIDANSFIVNIKTEIIYEDFANDFENRFDQNS